MHTRDQKTCSLSPASRIAVGLQILKCVLVPLVPERLKLAGLDPLTLLPASSPILKHGFEFDARAALTLLHAHTSLFSREDLASHIKTLSRLRDRWAHQQDLTQTNAETFLKTAASLCSELVFAPEARALRQLSKAPPDRSDDIAEHIENCLFTEAPLTFSALEESLGLRAREADLSDLHKTLVWLSAKAWLAGSMSLALLVRLGQDDTDLTEEIGLPGASFWWLLGHSHKTDVKIRQAALNEHLNQLDWRPAST